MNGAIVALLERIAQAVEKPIPGPRGGGNSGVIGYPKPSGKMRGKSKPEWHLPDEIEFEGKTYRRADHPKWFAVLDWSIKNRDKDEWGAKKVMAHVDASKPYVVSARRWWKDNAPK